MEIRGAAGQGVVSLLARILDAKAREVVALRAAAPLPPSRRPIDVLATLRRGSLDPLRLIAEIKLRSPSAGALSRRLSPAERAIAYAEAGATMVSVLCDAPFFDGSWQHLTEARRALDVRFPEIPVLAKEFVIDEAQITKARSAGADAILLIARIVSPSRLVELARAARDADLEPLVEVVDAAELEAAMAAEARVVGVNARDLDTLTMDPERTARVLDSIGRQAVAIHLSGLRDAASVAAVAAGRADAALIGEALMRVDDPRDRLVDFASAARSGRRAH